MMKTFYGAHATEDSIIFKPTTNTTVNSLLFRLKDVIP